MGNRLSYYFIEHLLNVEVVGLFDDLEIEGMCFNSSSSCNMLGHLSPECNARKIKARVGNISYCVLKI